MVAELGRPIQLQRLFPKNSYFIQSLQGRNFQKLSVKNISCRPNDTMADILFEILS
jgi:hypothetical protein